MIQLKGARASAAGLMAAVLVSGCATGVPALQGRNETRHDQIAREGNLVAHIKCELTRAFFWVEEDDDLIEQYRLAEAAEGRKPPPAPYGAAWLADWGSKVSLKIQVEESATLAPSLTVAKNLSNHISTFSEGGNVTVSRALSAPLALNGSSKATRTETIGFYFTFADLRAEQEEIWTEDVRLALGRKDVELDKDARRMKRKAFLDRSCPASDGVRMEGDLQIEDFIRRKITAGSAPGVIGRKSGAPPYDVFNYQVTFLVTNGGSFGPTWKLYPLSINQSAPLLAGNRAKTNDMLITLGKVDTTNHKAVKEAQDAHLAGLIGQSVADALRNSAP